MTAQQSPPALPCMCASFRRAARALTTMYEDALRPLDLSSTQFTILQVLSFAGEVSQGQLGRMLALDSTTLTRTLRIMLRRKWLRERRGDDRRERLISLAPHGRKLLERGSPAWEKVQRRLRTGVGEKAWDSAFALLNVITTLAAKGE
jgi:DNA-binding MarR family transcriptional regulator